MRINKGLIMIIIGMLVFASFPLTILSEENTEEEIANLQAEMGSYAAKDEVIYGKLDVNGKINNMYVVNTFHITEPGEIVDYGDYTNIRNLTDLSAIDQLSENEVHFQADEGEFYYQGELTDQTLPWNISIHYLLDGKEVNKDDLAGQSGALEIQITTTQNKIVDPLFFENYLMQISVALDPMIFNNIQAPKTTESNEGKNKLITFSVMPDTEEELIITADVTNLEMNPIKLSAIPANIAIENPDIGDMRDDMQELSDAIHEINSGVAELSDGVSELNDGTTKLSNGSTEYSAGINQLDQASSELVNGSQEIRDALEQVSTGLQEGADLPDMGNMEELPEGLSTMASGLKEAADGLSTLSEGYQEAYSVLDETIAGIPDYTITPEQFAELYQSGADQTVVDQLTKTYEAAQTVKHTYSAVKDGFTAVTGELESVSSPLYVMAEQMKVIADGMESAMSDLEQLDALAELQEGLSTLASEYNSFHNGLTDYTDGVHSLAVNYQDLNAGIQGVSDGTSELDDGVGKLHEGTTELESATNDIPGEMQSQIDELMAEYDNGDFEPISFVSDKNEHVDLVQFVLQTESIEIDEPEEVEDEEEEKKGIWTRFLDLFR